MSFERETMLNVARHYAARRLQDPSCTKCEYADFEDPDATIPEGWEELRGYEAIVRQCDEHDRLEYPWLGRALERAADWLVLQSANGPFQVDFEELRRALEREV